MRLNLYKKYYRSYWIKYRHCADTILLTYFCSFLTFHRNKFMDNNSVRVKVFLFYNSNIKLTYTSILYILACSFACNILAKMYACKRVIIWQARIHEFHGTHTFH